MRGSLSRRFPQRPYISISSDLFPTLRERKQNGISRIFIPALDGKNQSALLITRCRECGVIKKFHSRNGETE
jgi:hypothetical protein